MNNKMILFQFFMASFFFLHGCSPCSYEEVSRIKSPDGRVEAVQVRGNCGATTPYSESVFIVPTGDKTPSTKGNYQRFLADHVSGFQLKWREPKFLEIQYEEARIFRFTNFWQSKKVDDFSYVVEIRLVPTKTDFSLSRKDRWLDK